MGQILPTQIDLTIEMLYKSTYDILISLAEKYVGENSKDVLQDMWEGVIKKCHNGNPASCLNILMDPSQNRIGFLVTICRNNCLDYIRKKGRELKTEEIEIASLVISYPDYDYNIDMNLVKNNYRITDIEFDIFQKNKVEGWPFKAISDFHGIDIYQVKKIAKKVSAIFGVKLTQ